jgi:succinate dehydrogenase / fumarate reductase iron-sulfur subunit
MGVDRENRRSALASIVSAGLGLVTAGLAGLVGLAAAPPGQGATRRWRRAASLFDLPANQPMTAVLAERHADGWYETRKQSVVFIDRQGQGYRALSATCQHLGCRVHWDDTKQQFRCPCHGGTYDREGNVVSGPPPRGLERLNVRVNPHTSDLEIEL